MTWQDAERILNTKSPAFLKINPAWKPPATLAEEMYCIISSSKPIFHGPKLSPMSQLRSICTVLTCLSEHA